MAENEATAIFRKKCSLCDGTMLDSCLKLPETPPANDFAKSKEEARAQDRYPLELLMCADCRHVQTSVIVLPEKLFKNYVYATSTSPVTLAHLADQGRAILALFPGQIPSVMEVGSNDGALGKELVKLGLPPELYVGVEPSETMAKVATETGVNTLNRFFGWDLAKEMVVFGRDGGSLAFGEGGEEWRNLWRENPHPDVIVANNVFAHVPSVKEKFTAVQLLLDETGLLIMDVAWAADIFVDLAFDTIYHEHMSYHALSPLMSALKHVGMEVFDVDVMPGQVGRGSLRVFASSEGERPVNQEKISSILLQEKRLRLHLISSWRMLGNQILAVGERFRHYLYECYEQKKTVMGYGAPAKLTTLLHACYVHPENNIISIADDSPWKQGLYTPGMGIPVVSPSQIFESKPDVVVVFAWNFFDDIARKLREGGYMGAIYNPMGRGIE